MNSNISNFLKKITRFEISSDYDSKDNVFNNYHSTIDQHTNPEILLELDAIDSPLDFKIIWYNESNDILKEEIIFLNKTKTKIKIHRKFFNQTESMKFNATGICRVELKYMEKFILSKEFLVIPSESEIPITFSDLIWVFKFNRFWKLHGVCFHSLEKYGFIEDNFANRCDKTHWSTHYPDPKSDFMISNYENRLKI